MTKNNKSKLKVRKEKFWEFSLFTLKYGMNSLQFAAMTAIDSGAGPPLAQLYLIPKSASIPPGLWEAVRRMPPSACCLRTIADRAGVDKIPSECQSY